MTTTISTPDPLPLLSVELEDVILLRFGTVLQSGFYRNVTEGTTIASFLSTLPGFTGEYITNRLQTIFLNGDAIDDLELAFSNCRATLALSAAMPGLAGAIFKRNSRHAILRKTAALKTYNKTCSSVSVRIKLFNIIATERGPDLLAEGVVLKTESFSSFLKIRPALIEAMQQMTIDNQPLPQKDLHSFLKQHDKFIFKYKNINA